VNHWDGSQHGLCVLLPKLVNGGHIPARTLDLPKSWVSQIQEDFNNMVESDDGTRMSFDPKAAYLNGLLEMIRTIPLDPIIDSDINSQVFHAMIQFLQSGAINTPTSLQKLIIGNGFKYLANSKNSTRWDELWPLICANSALFHHMPIFLQAVQDLVQSHNANVDLKIADTRVLVDSLMDSLSSPSYELRLAALEILQVLIQARDGVISSILSSAISIASTRPTIETARSISMQIRGLAASYNTIAADPWLNRAIPMLCFGLLHVKFSQIWEDACFALKEICNTKEGEQVVCETAFHWLEGCEVVDSDPPEDADSSQYNPDIDFAGMSFQQLQLLVRKTIALGNSADSILQTSFQEIHTEAQLVSPFNRTQALKVLKHIPQYAEKRSRSLVPVLLAWALHDVDVIHSDDEIQQFKESASPTLSNPSLCKWTRKEQKAMLSLFALFLNPKVLYKSTEVHSALLVLLENGDIEIQKSALEALFAWKDPSISRYEEDLLKLLDDAKFREQISVFLDIGQGETSLRTDDRAAAMPIILRLLYGRVITRGKGGKSDQGSNRKAVFVLLSRFLDTEINQFIDIALGPLHQVSLVQHGIFRPEEFGKEFSTQRKQFGLLNMLKDLLDTWKSTATPYVAKLVDPIIYCLIRSLREISEQDTEKTSKNSLPRSIRQVAILCLNMLFEISPDLDWFPYMSSLFNDLINPRLENLAAETSQGISALVRMFATWSHSALLAPFLGNYNGSLLTKVAECIGQPTAKDEVKRFVTNEIVCALITQADGEKDSAQGITTLLKAHASPFLDQLAHLLRSDPPKDLLEDSVQAVVRLAEYTATCPAGILASAAYLLQMPARRASHRIKVNLLKILLRFLSTLEVNGETFNQVYAAICASFAFFTDKESRTLLSNIANEFAAMDPSLVETANLCEDLNSFAYNRLDGPDFGRRLHAFGIINGGNEGDDGRYSHFSAQQWRLLLGNMMLYVKDVDETAIRKSASHSLRRFVEAASQKSGEEADEFMAMLKGTIISGIEKGVRDQPEEVQTEYLAVLAHTVKLHPQWSAVSDMTPLLGADDEASFFISILHIQKQHRRLPAMRRLAEEAKLGTLSSNNVYHILIPLIERFIFNPRDEFLSAEEVRTAEMLSAEATRTIGVLVEWIDWQQCRVLLKRFISYVKTKAELQETILKLLDATTTAICHSSSLKSQTPVTGGVADKEFDGPALVATRLAKTMPAKEKMTQYLVQDVISPLTGFLHDKDESFVSRRISVAVIVARFLQLLPQDEFEIRLPALLTDTCNILRSKDQGSRDLTRKALTTICKLIGPSSVGYVLRELRSALQRGFYLHVLSYTAHSILETTTPSFKPGDLDYCASDIMTIIMEDIFGNTGKEKEAAEYLKDKTTKKEVKGKKSFDSMQLLASITSLTHLINLVRPIESLLYGRLNLKDARNIDELLRRIELGLLQNESVRDRDVLVFCYEVIKDTQNITPAKAKPSSKYLVNKNSPGANSSLRSSDAIGRLTRFALELVRSVLRKHKNLQTPANISGFMPIIGDALLSNLDDVKLASIRLFTAILNIPLPRIDSDAPVYIAEAARIIDDSPTTNDELAQAALKLISAVLRERRNADVKVKTQTLAILLKKMKPDLQVISQQGVAFNLLRAIIGRKIVIPELYEVIDGDDGVASISVRDHDRTTRDLARRVYFQFLMDYPQSEGRFAKQLTFLVRNLEYEHAEGRQSVMDTLHLLLTKVGDTMVQDIVQAACWPLVSVMVNDDSSQCREMAAGLVKTVFDRADDEWVKNFLALFRRMLEHGTKDVQKRTALQCWTIYLEVNGAEAKEVAYVQKQISKVLDQDSEDFDTEEWQLVYYALHTQLIICKHRADIAFGSNTQILWDKVQKHLSFPQSWVKQEAAKLIGMYVADFANSKSVSLSDLPLIGSYGLKLDAPGMCTLAARNLRLLREGVSEELAAQAVRNLAFLGRCFATNGIEWHRPKDGTIVSDANIELDDEAESEDDDEDFQEDRQMVAAIDHLFHVLAGITRRELRKPEDPSQAIYRRADVLYPKTAALQLTAALCTTLPAASLTPSIDTILLPLIHLTDTNITAPTSQDPSFTDAYNALITNATELMDLLQNKLGTTAYVQVLQRVKKGMQAKRDERRIKRKIQAVSMPERAEVAKKRKRESDKVKRREKGEIARGKRRGW
jgi:U3 small nucleolar RNA-associated protein 20